MATLNCVDCTKEYSEQLDACPNCHAPNPTKPPAPPATEAPIAPTPQTKKTPTAGWVAVLAGGLIAIGSILPWITATAVFVGSISVGGMEGDGKITVALGVLLLILGFVAIGGGKMHPGPLILLGIGAIAVVVANYSNIQDVVDETRKSGVGVASIGYGFWMVAIGGVVAVVGAALAKR